MNKKIALPICFLLCLCCCFGIFFCLPKNHASALETPPPENVFSSLEKTDGNFTVKMTAQSRINSTLADETCTGSEGQTYQVFSWRELSFLRFSFSSNINASAGQHFTGYQFKVTHVASSKPQTQDVNQAVEGSTLTQLFNNNISNNVFSSFDLTYYTDSDAIIAETATRFKGKDYGLYKFDFSYSYLQDAKTIWRSVGDIYVAVMPDDIDKITTPEIKIEYTVASSNKLMNVFNLTLSKDTFKYVEPQYVEWIVTGTDTQNRNYIYCTNEDDQYAEYQPLWSSPDVKPFGTSFVFDSHDVEGTWNVKCIVRDSKGIKLTRELGGLSTIKVQKESKVWIILVCIAGVILLAGVITIVVLKLKKDKVW